LQGKGVSQSGERNYKISNDQSGGGHPGKLVCALNQTEFNEPESKEQGLYQSKKVSVWLLRRGQHKLLYLMGLLVVGIPSSADVVVEIWERPELPC
jgi:hypothetical protein